MIRNRTTRALLLSSIVALTIIVAAFFAVSSPTHAASAQASPNTAPPFQSNISQKVGGLPHFVPKTLACTRVHGQTCITIKNTTPTSQSVTFNGVVAFTLLHGQSQALTYKKAGTYVYSLSSNTAVTLTVTVS